MRYGGVERVGVESTDDLYYFEMGIAKILVSMVRQRNNRAFHYWYSFANIFITGIELHTSRSKTLLHPLPEKSTFDHT